MRVAIFAPDDAVIGASLRIQENAAVRRRDGARDAGRSCEILMPRAADGLRPPRLTHRAGGTFHRPAIQQAPRLAVNSDIRALADPSSRALSPIGVGSDR